MKLQIDSKSESKPTPRKTNWVAVVGLSFLILVFMYYIVVPKDGSRDERPTAAIFQIKTFRTALDAYKNDTGAYPRTIDGLLALLHAPLGVTNWHGPYLKNDVPPDPWGQNYIYICPGIHNSQSYDLSSRGPDGYVGNDDDIANWTRR